MQFYRVTSLLIIVMHFDILRGIGYNCSQFDGYLAYDGSQPLVKCPQATFMLKDNLLECFDNHTKFNTDSQEYWCVSRRDIDEEYIKKLIVTPDYVYNELSDLIFKPFSTRYFSNKTHLKCDSVEEWAGSWYSIYDYRTIPCTTNTTISVNMKYRLSTNTL